MKDELGKGWFRALSAELGAERLRLFNDLLSRLYSSQLSETIYPRHHDVFRAFNLTPFEEVRVVILGQDPYHQPDQAQGLSFSVAKGTTLPPSLRNIFTEIKSDLGHPATAELVDQGDLGNWARQGVFLLNTSLTVVQSRPGSHARIGWQEFTDAAIAALSSERNNLVFMLWGKHAQSKLGLIDQSKHLVLSAPHPSPLSARRGFFGCRHFSQANNYLAQTQNTQKIDW